MLNFSFKIEKDRYGYNGVSRIKAIDLNEFPIVGEILGVKYLIQDNVKVYFLKYFRFFLLGFTAQNIYKKQKFGYQGEM
jgi:hypothetical protein